MSLNDHTPKNYAIAFGVIGVPAIALMVWMSTYEPDAPPEPEHLDDAAIQRVDAERYCKLEVEARLKAPSTAKYSGVTAAGSGTISVSGSVDSENSFGAMLRNDFSCRVTLVGDRWNLESIDVG